MTLRFPAWRRLLARAVARVGVWIIRCVLAAITASARFAVVTGNIDRTRTARERR